jgi:hypothetical protein
MDQGETAILKVAYYLCQTFLEMVRVLDRSDVTIKDYWYLFNI